MKTIDLFCASPASTAICSSMDQRSVIRHITRPISRHAKTLPLLPCQSQLPIDPKSLYHKNRKSTSSSKQSDSQRKSSADKNDLSSPPGSTRYLLSDTPFFDMLSDSDHVKTLVPSQITRHGHLSPNDSPSSQYPSRGQHSDHVKALVPSNKLKSGHLSSPIYSPQGRDSDHVKALVPSNKLIPGHLSSTKHSPRRQDPELVNVLVPSQKMRPENLMSSDSPSLKSSSTRSRPRDKVVELWVSIHCRGCEGKVRKHISRMEGVTSFSIDLATKKVTIIGDVTPLGVLTSVSRVKNAQFWPSPTLSSSSSLSSSPMVDRGY